MNEIITAAAEYITRMTGEKLTVAPVDANALSLPLIVTAGYEYDEVTLFGVRVLLACQIEEMTTTPARLAAQSSRIRQAYPGTVAFVFSSMASYNVHRLIKKRVNFIIPGKQMFLPDLLLDLGRNSESKPESEEIPATAQLLVLYHLQKGNLGGKHGNELAEMLHTSPAGITRAVKWLCAHGLTAFTGGKYKTLQFLHEGKVLWDNALPLLVSPVIRTVFTDEAIEGVASGQNALAKYSMLVEANYHITAIGKKTYQTIEPQTDSRFGDNRIEVWKYDPELLAESGFVDKLSLYLSMRNDSDERTQKELKILLEEMIW